MQVLQQGLRLHGHVKAFLIGASLAAIILTVGGYFIFQHQFKNRFYEGIFIDNVDLSGLTSDEAQQKLTGTPEVFAQMITLTSNDVSVASSEATLGLHREYKTAIDQAIQLGRNEGFITNTSKIFRAYTKGKAFNSHLAFDPIKVQDFVKELAVKANLLGEEPSATIKNGQIEINIGKMGNGIMIEDTAQSILSAANSATRQFTAMLSPTGTQLTPIQADEAKHRAEKFIGKSIEGKVDVITVEISDAQLITSLKLPLGYNNDEVEKILKMFTDKIDRPAQNAKFSYDEQTMKVKEFEPDLDGITIDKQQTKNQVLEVLKNIEQGIPDKVTVIAISKEAKKADISLGSLNNLGLKERIGFGETYYYHSIPTRIHNVSLAAKIVNNTLVKPGEEFSFNKALGDVSKATGFQPAYVIQSGQTVLGDGGGVCQVSTTLFRALLDSGLKITKRRAHSYRVSYYELNKDPGFDATVYAGDVDLRFLNDSPQAVLLHFETFPDKLYMVVTIYGTSDGRTTEISEYKKWDVRGAPPSQYIDDPTLPPGKLVQIDFAVGGIKASFKHTVKDKDGNVTSENTYYSNYVPWSAKYRRGV